MEEIAKDSFGWTGDVLPPGDICFWGIWREESADHLRFASWFMG